MPSHHRRRHDRGSSLLPFVALAGTAWLAWSVLCDRTGARRAGVVEITEGLGLGDRIIVDGTGKVRPGQKVAPTQDTERMPASKGQADVAAGQDDGAVR